jgi:hypothetical protein
LKFAPAAIKVLESSSIYPAKMATSTVIRFQAKGTNHTFSTNLTQDAADKISELLQENHRKYHIMWNFKETTLNIQMHVSTPPINPSPSLPSS